MHKSLRNEFLTGYAQKLRKNMTDEERHLWYDFLKMLPVTVHKQYVIGNYIADFYIASKSIVIELDGIGHMIEEQEEYDRRRDKYMQSQGLTVLRYSNVLVNYNFDFVCKDILRNLGISEEEAIKFLVEKPSPLEEKVARNEPDEVR